MCNNIIGSEEEVKTIRMMNNVRDNLTSNELFFSITSGSFGEGIVMQGSDLDVMDVYKDIEVNEDTKSHFKPYKTYLKIKTDDTPPGFTQLRLVHSYFSNVNEVCVEVDGEYYFSNKRVKAVSGEKNLEIEHGPCLSDKSGIIDLALCLRSKSRITQANKWITRPNNAWPGYEVKKTVIKHGVLFVPVGVKGSTKEESEWRISFSAGEKFLIYSFTHTQLLSYVLMKMLKDVISRFLHCQELLCSYFMKTIVFWLSEETPPKKWRPENLISCFMRCFSRLIYCVEYSVCPHYFIPENNLFRNKIKGQARLILLENLYTLKTCGWHCLIHSGKISNIPYFMNLTSYIHKKPSYSHVNIMKKIFFSVMYLVERHPRASADLENVIHMILSTDSSKIKYFYVYYLSKMFSGSAQRLPFHDKCGNKSAYKQYKTCISTLLKGNCYDTVSGWLFLASFIYRTKQYKTVLRILEYSLMKCSSEKFCVDLNLSNIPNDLLNLYIFRKMYIVQLFKILRVNCITFYKRSSLIPDEIQNNETLRIPPVVFAHFLRSLCYYHLNDTRQTMNSLHDIQLTIEENYLIGGTGQKGEAYAILGILFQIIGDKNSARQAFMQSIEFYPEPDMNIAYHRLSLIS